MLKFNNVISTNRFDIPLNIFSYESISLLYVRTIVEYPYLISYQLKFNFSGSTPFIVTFEVSLNESPIIFGQLLSSLLLIHLTVKLISEMDFTVGNKVRIKRIIEYFRKEIKNKKKLFLVLDIFYDKYIILRITKKIDF